LIICSEGHKEFKPAHFVYPLNRALQAALEGNEPNFPITFVPVGILIEGKPSRPFCVGAIGTISESRL